MAQLAESSLTRLRNWDVSDEQIEALAKTGEAKRSVTFRSPATGIVMEKKAVSGMRFMPGEMLYQVADLSRVWVLADVNEQDIGQVTNGRKAQVRINAYPDKRFEGVVTYVYPTLKPETRTRVRAPGARQSRRAAQARHVRPGRAFGRQRRGKVVAVPVSAVIDSGVRRVVIVQPGEGRFEPREVELGARSEDWVEVTLRRRRKASRSWSRPTSSSTRKATCARRSGAWAPRPRPPTAEGGEPPRRRHARRDRRAGRHGDDHPRAGGEPQVAGDDDGLRARQRLPGGEREAGCARSSSSSSSASPASG